MTKEMQKSFKHLSKRHQVLMLFHGNQIEDHKEWDEEPWNEAHKNPETKGTSSIIVIAKFYDHSQEKVFFCDRAPHWWYIYAKGRNPVIQEEIKQWKYLKRVDVSS